MADSYRIIGAEMSPYSVKVRSYFRYKAIPHQWILRNAASQPEYEKYAKMPIIPLVVTPEGAGIQDSTPIIDRLEKLYPQPSIHPDDAVTQFISALIEEFGDEWGNKWMFHYRWARDVDQRSSAGRIARMRARKPKWSMPPLVVRSGPGWSIGSGSWAPRGDSAANRGRLPRHAWLADSHLHAGLICSADGRRWRFRPVGTDLRDVDRPHRRRPDRWRHAACGLSTACFGRKRRASLRPGLRWSQP